MTATMCDLYPAIDLRGGRVVRLTKGDYDAETVYGDDPVAVARSFVAAGAPWVHVVDLDAAKSGDPVNRPVVEAIAAALHGSAALQNGGGVRMQWGTPTMIQLAKRSIERASREAGCAEAAAEITRAPSRMARNGFTGASKRSRQVRTEIVTPSVQAPAVTSRVGWRRGRDPDRAQARQP